MPVQQKWYEVTRWLQTVETATDVAYFCFPGHKAIKVEANATSPKDITALKVTLEGAVVAACHFDVTPYGSVLLRGLTLKYHGHEFVANNNYIYK